jgi:hypothetical protein
MLMIVLLNFQQKVQHLSQHKIQWLALKLTNYLVLNFTLVMNVLKKCGNSILLCLQMVLRSLARLNVLVFVSTAVSLIQYNYLYHYGVVKINNFKNNFLKSYPKSIILGPYNVPESISKNCSLHLSNFEKLPT